MDNTARRNAASNKGRTHYLFYDCLFLTFIVIVSFCLYIGKLGFYSDDWAFLGIFTLAPDQSFIGFIKAFLFPLENTTTNLMRPVHAVYAASLYWLFGLQPVGYHLINGLVLVAINLILYLGLRYLNLPRIISVTLPLIFILLPNYSTDRFWFASFQINLSLLFYFISLYSGLVFLHSNKKKVWWAILSFASLVISILSYEVVIPLYILNILLFWNPRQKIYLKNNQPIPKIKSKIILNLVTMILVLITVSYKVLTTERLENGPLQTLDYHYFEYIWYIIKSAILVNYYETLFKLPYLVWGIFYNSFNEVIFMTGALLGVSIFCYLYFAVVRKDEEILPKSFFAQLILVSLIIFIAGYAIFFVNNNIGFTTTGIGNRVAIAGAVGVALTILGGVGWMSSLLPKKFFRIVFCGSITFITFCGFIIINSLATFWVDAYPREVAVINAIHPQISHLDYNSVVILDGVCPFIYPAIVFESSWDLRGALRVVSGKDTIKTDVVKPNVIVKEEGIYTKIYSQETTYSYSNLYIYNFLDLKLIPIFSINDANKYFLTSNSTNLKKCPPSQDGHGVTYFN